MLRDLTPVLWAAEEDRELLDTRYRLTERLAEAVTAAGFARHFVPARRGGTAGSFTRLLETTAQLAETCASTAWCAALYAAHGRLSSYLPEQGQEELWGASPDVRIAASVVPPQGTARRAGSSWHLTGTWRMASGVDHATWVLLASSTPGDGGAVEHRIFAVPRADVTVRDTWRPIGLRGTGTNTVEADVLVPGHLTCTVGDLARPRPDAARCHTVPYGLVAALIFAGPVLGAARGMVRAWQDDLAGRDVPASTGRLLARSSAQIGAAQLLLEQAAWRSDHAEVTPLLTAENQRDVTLAVEWCGDAADQLLRGLGARALAEGDPQQRRWRDIAAARAHGALSFETAAARYAEVALSGPKPATSEARAA
ncbi:oxidoreductase [Streptomyces sp. NPDC097941]|uniref:oxidoreductase n=1 Tax=Streptomyces sp. NPDC097941 TaxID=3155685 RepID=UPI003325CC4A